MAVVKPFRGITYNFDRFQDLGTLVTPPYDVISASEQEEFYRVDPNNVIRLELGKTNSADTDQDSRYTRSAAVFRKWLEQGVLVRAQEPFFYVSAHSYLVGKESRTRWGIVARVKIEEEGSDVILPHEQTFPAHKTDRLKLMEACGAQFSQVFSIYENPRGLLREIASYCESVRPQASFSFKDGSRHRMWAISDIDMKEHVENSFRDATLYIADGHHRYETARNYRNAVRDGTGGEAGGAHEYVMMYLSGIDERGLTILPYHRLLAAAAPFDPDAFKSRITEYFTVDLLGTEVSGNPEAIERMLAEAGGNATSFILCTRDSGRLLLRLKPDASEHMDADLHPALKRLDVQVLSELVFQKTIGFTPTDMENDEWFRFDSSVESCLARVGSGETRAAFLMNPTPIEDVREVARAGLVMPRKSTFFHPKVLTGLVFNPLEDHAEL